MAQSAYEQQAKMLFGIAELETQPSGTIKALSLNQPWATLVAIGAKHIETRSWGTQYRGPIAIHASKRFASADKLYVTKMPFVQDLVESGHRKIGDIPLGAVLSIVNLVDCIKMTEGWIDSIAEQLDEKELKYGFYEIGRFAWVFSDDIKRFEKPIPCKGSLGLWNWALPENEAVLGHCTGKSI